ncbi:MULTISPECIES: hypothetical protein [Tsukamurella]|uniref:Uncharacterized protein n=2 Tax=Tsukamurella TaxID=2060 RepID=A0A5C5RW04_9ACTN|nr:MULTISPECIES: hypothetical protein [Tsukamurella]NMD55634.1 hypothetical protein [Tsukamurella columbiensis]TWS26954.1 hypothetical protein FK530_21340 [Tsukamurella conjunctivitidis]
MHTDGAITWGKYTVVQPGLREDLRGEGGVVVEDGSLFLYRRSGDVGRLVQVLATGQWHRVSIAE